MAFRSVFPIAALALAACTTYQEPPGTPLTSSSGAPVVSSAAYVTSLPSGSYKPGYGVLESISLANPPAQSASAGGTTAPPARGPYRLTLRMDDGTSQTVTHDTRAYLVGDRLQITPDGRLIRP